MKKFFCILLSAMLLLTSLPTTVFAASTCKITVSSASGYRDDIIEAKITLSANSNAQACGFVLTYDPSILQVVETEKGSIISGSPIINTNQLGKIVYSYASTTPIKSSGSVLNVKFKIKQNAPYGDSELSLKVTELSDGSFNEISYSIVSGKVNVVAPELAYPSYIEVIALEDTYAEIRWEGVESATGYNIYLNGELFNDEPLTDNLCTFYSLSQDEEYSIEISTLHYQTESQKSPPHTIRTQKSVYSVSFVDWNFGTESEDENSILEIVYVEHGGEAFCSVTPTRAGYKFVGWDVSGKNIVTHTRIQALYEPIVSSVIFIDWDGTVLSTQTVEYGGSAEAPAIPSREGYIFTVWSNKFDNVTEDITVQAQYEEITCEHTNTEIQGKVDSTCKVPGFAGNLVCKDCGKTLSFGGELELAKHNYNSVVTAPTPSAQGYTTHTCTMCGDSYVDSYNDYVDENAPQIVIQSKRVTKGQQFTVAVEIKNNPGIASAFLNIAYDESVLTLVEVKDTGLISGGMHSSALTSPYQLSWLNGTLTKDITDDGVIANLVFKVADNAELGDYSIRLSYDYDNYDIINVDMEPVQFHITSSVVAVSDFMYGDVNNDGRVNLLDSTILARYLAKWPDYTEDTLNLQAADVNADGRVNLLDSTILARHLAKWPEYSELPLAN